MSITDIMRNTSEILESLEEDDSNNDDEKSYNHLFNTFVNYAINSSKKLADVEGKAKANLKHGSGLSSDTEFSSYFNEESSTEGSDDIEANDSSFDHEEDFDSENDSESFGTNSINSKID